MTSDLRIMSSSLCDSYCVASVRLSMRCRPARVRSPWCGDGHAPLSRGDRRLFLRRRFGPLVGQHGPELERLVCRLVGLLVEELPQAGVVGVFIVGDLDRLAF